MAIALPIVLIFLPSNFELRRMSWVLRTSWMERSTILCSKRVGMASGRSLGSMNSWNMAVSVNHSRKRRTSCEPCERTNAVLCNIENPFS